MRIPQVIMLAAAATQQSITVSNDVMTDSIIAAVQAVHTSCLVNTDVFSQYTGGALPTTTTTTTSDTNSTKAILLTFASVNGAQTKILTDSIMTPKLTAPNFQRAAHVVLETLQFSVPATGEAMVAKIPQLKDAGLLVAARNSLELLLSNHEAAGAAIGPKVDTSDAALAAALHQEVVDVTERLVASIEAFKEVTAGDDAVVVEGTGVGRMSAGVPLFA